jgi:hypothetical protein
MSAFNDGFRREWFLQAEMRKADSACYTACGMSLHSAWTSESGCYVGGSWMSPSKIARGIAQIVFDWSDEE